MCEPASRVGSHLRSAPNLTVVVTSGTGGTGYLGVQLAKAMGAARVVTATSGAANIALARALGADVVVDYKVQDVIARPRDSGTRILLLEPEKHSFLRICYT